MAFAWTADAQITLSATSVFTSTAIRTSGEWLSDNPGTPTVGDNAERRQIVSFAFFDLAPYASLLPDATGMSLQVHLDKTEGNPNQLEIDWMGYFSGAPTSGTTRLMNLQAAGFTTDITSVSPPGTFAVDLSPLLPLAASAPLGQQVLGFRFQQSLRENGNYEPDTYTFSANLADLNLAAVPEPSQMATAVGLGIIGLHFLSRRGRRS